MKKFAFPTCYKKRHGLYLGGEGVYFLQVKKESVEFWGAILPKENVKFSEIINVKKGKKLWADYLEIDYRKGRKEESIRFIYNPMNGKIDEVLALLKGKVCKIDNRIHISF
jgi:hypothetical protein